MRQALGVAVFAGMIGVTVFGLAFTPVFYVVHARPLGAAAETTAERPEVPTTAGCPHDEEATEAMSRVPARLVRIGAPWRSPDAPSGRAMWRRRPAPGAAQPSFPQARTVADARPLPARLVGLYDDPRPRPVGARGAGPKTPGPEDRRGQISPMPRACWTRPARAFSPPHGP